MFELDQQSAGLMPSVSPTFSDSQIGPEQKARDLGQRFVAFFLGESLYALASEKVEEVLHPPAVTPLPEMPEWLLGISNLRGEVIAVVNSRKLLGCGSATLTERSRLLLLAQREGQAQVALPVDGLDEVLNLAASDIEARNKQDAPAVFGRARNGEKLFQIIDADQIMSALQTSEI